MLAQRWLGCLLFVGAVASPVPAFAGEGAVALRTAAMSCADGSESRFVDCGNGTVTDNETGLVWLANSNCFGAMGWHEAMALVAGLADLPDDGYACSSLTPDECDCGLSDHSSPGEWRLPSVAEWKAMISCGWDSDTCEVAIANDMGNGCWSDACVEMTMCSFYDVQASWYWSSSTYVLDPEYAWLGDLALGQTYMLARESSAYVWPVRGGQ